MALLEIDKLTMTFGGLSAVKDFDLRVETGKIYSIIGPNGAGKTTVFNALTGIYEPSAGHVRFAGRELARPLTWHVIVASVVVALLTGIAGMVLARTSTCCGTPRSSATIPIQPGRFPTELHWPALERTGAAIW
jgi:ABC-type branched-subunit amino acid transport system ATPase component